MRDIIAVPPGSLTTPYRPDTILATLSGFRSPLRGSGAAALFTRWGLYHAPPLAMPPMADASCMGVTVTAPCPIATEIVSPAYHFSRCVRSFHLEEGIRPSASFGKSTPVFLPK